MTLTQLTSATEKFNDGTLEDKKQVLSALGSNPILTEGRLSLEEYFWLQPIKKDKQILIDKLEKVRTSSQQIKKRLLKRLFINTGAGMESRTPISSLGRIHNSRYTIPATSLL